MQLIEVETGSAIAIEVENGRFAAVERMDGAPGDGDARRWILPGLVDVHNHLSLGSPAGDDADPSERVRASASLELAIGVLALREPGSPDDASLGLAAESGWPRVVTAGRFLAPPGRYFPGLAREVPAPDLRAAAIEECRRSGGWVKLIGDFLDPLGRFTANWPRDVLTDAVEAVHAMGGRVAVHVVCAEAVDDMVAAGVDSIEHGWAVNECHFDEMRRRGIAWVPTLIEGGAETACAFAASVGVDESDQRWMRDVIGRQPSVAAMAHAAGITVLAGTDAGQGPHGRIVEQVELMAQGGLSRHDALGAASWDARRYIGVPGIEIGAPADYVLYDADPNFDLDALRRPASIVLDGRALLGQGVPH
jgi:imidazolonepropionase-like amidohydrolase